MSTYEYDTSGDVTTTTDGGWGWNESVPTDGWGASDDAGWGDDSAPVIMPGLIPGGNPLPLVNLAAVLILSAVLGCSIAGYLIDVYCIRKRFEGPASLRPRGWVVGMLFASYTLLVPGLVCTLFAFKISQLNGSEVLKDIQENMLEFTKELWDFGAYFGVACILGFAMVIPLVKLVLLCVGGWLRHSDDEAQVQIARRSIHFVQVISKWASPDMFAYILLLYLIRKLDHPPMMDGLMHLDMGFSCFSTFCVFSTVSSLGVRSPLKPDKGRVHRLPSPVFTLALSIVCLILFTVCLVIGMREPAMSLSLDFDKMVEAGELAPEMLDVVKSLGIAEMAKDDVSLWSCIWELWNWSFPKNAPIEVNTFIAFTMLGVFSVLFTIVDMITLVVIAGMMQFSPARPYWGLEVTHLFRKLSMLDVTVVGVVVIVLAGAIYAKMGVILKLNTGIYFLAVAEAAHYVIHYTVVDVASHMPAYESAGTRDLESELKGMESDESNSDTEKDSSE
mmetsp:Transcript_37293/g.79180  ORF Transcript_37293/g.79180 Transcript_37293/m.79180 type:complete len:503 (-) Transcript_37293:146-1654(-)|eukprot:CAMPEP_0206497038 /NCGR_PEP_ID=MMETSP0324_2-20121206/49883_1 /ASSEMBLY_ACC=CAM_ASM_000836 /TAXON_ID=2866 /ORGANISM="Crypthecodinium cohnii, Strain Seligo" /LENGTH=502 /DNA_ID=CAMNT_0053982403 /DNA_START=253 /DNA_END=1761 /DNA_ORIENTATION=+